MFKQFIADYLNFTKKERRGNFVILFLIVCCLLLPFFFSWFIAEPEYDHVQFEKEIAALNMKQLDSSVNYSNRNFDENNYQNYYQPTEKKSYTKQFKGELFYFDPNTLSVEGWKKLGVREKTAVTISKYVSKGGKFYKPEDIGKIWGLHPDEVDRLLPYVRITSQSTTAYASAKVYEPNKASDKPVLSLKTIDINEADTSALVALPGIGSKLANRIIAFRNKLGGFYNIDQVGETFALPDSTFQKIKSRLVINNSDVKKININKASLDEMKTHPYIRYNIANVILQYRNIHGDFAAVYDLKKIMIITDDIFNKASPYLTVK